MVTEVGSTIVITIDFSARISLEENERGIAFDWSPLTWRTPRFRPSHFLSFCSNTAMLLPPSPETHGKAIVLLSPRPRRYERGRCATVSPDRRILF
jgi:hypothetical protein